MVVLRPKPGLRSWAAYPRVCCLPSCSPSLKLRTITLALRIAKRITASLARALECPSASSCRRIGHLPGARPGSRPRDLSFRHESGCTQHSCFPICANWRRHKCRTTPSMSHAHLSSSSLRLVLQVIGGWTATCKFSAGASKEECR
jgi:hypothetical protein